MPITFHCGCGQSMTVADQFAGKMGRCPRCKQAITVPLASTAAPPMAPMAPPVASAPATPRPMPRPGAVPPPAPPPAPRTTAMPAMPPMAHAAPGTPPAQPRPAAPPSAAARPGAKAPAKPGGKAAATLQVVTGPQGFAGRAFPVLAGKPTVIGRDPQADVPIPSERISRRHCQLEPTEDGVFVLADLGSSNGTLVNQERVAGRKVLLGGEYIQVGDVLLRFADS